MDFSVVSTEKRRLLRWWEEEGSEVRFGFCAELEAWWEFVLFGSSSGLFLDAAETWQGKSSQEGSHPDLILWTRVHKKDHTQI